MINFKKAVATLLAGCVAGQSTSMFSVYAFPDGFKPGQSVSIAEYFEKSFSYLKVMGNTRGLITQCEFREKMHKDVGDDFVSGLLASYWTLIDPTVLNGYTYRGPTPCIREIMSHLDEKELTYIDSASIIHSCVESFRMYSCVKKYARFLPQHLVDDVKSGYINNLLVMVACLYKCNYPKLASLLYVSFSVANPDEEKLLFDDICVVDTFNAGAEAHTTDPKRVISCMRDMVIAGQSFYKMLFDMVSTMEKKEHEELEKHKKEEEEKRNAELKDQSQKKADAKARRAAKRAAKRAEKEEAQRKAEEDARLQGEEVARLKEEEEDRRRAEEKAKRDAEEAAEREKEARLKAEHDASGVTAVMEANRRILNRHCNEPNHDSIGLIKFPHSSKSDVLYHNV